MSRVLPARFIVTSTLDNGLTLENGLGNGGAVFVSQARASATRCIFADNAAPNGLGGAIYNPGSPLEFSNCTFGRNTAAGFGLGGVFFGTPNAAVTMTDCTITENFAHDGEAIFGDAELTLVRCIFTGNSIPADGIAGVVFNQYPTFITGCIFTGNSAGEGGEGGALFIGDGIIRVSVIAGNAVGLTSEEDSQGGGIWNFGTLRIENSTVANNTSGDQSQGAGIYNDGALILNNSTLSGNAAGATRIQNHLRQQQRARRGPISDYGRPHSESAIGSKGRRKRTGLHNCGASYARIRQRNNQERCGNGAEGNK